MSTGWSAARSCRLPLARPPGPLATVVMDGDRWLTAPVDPSGVAERPVDLAAGIAVASAMGAVPWPRFPLATGVAADDVVAAASTGLVSTDRAPPVPAPLLVQSALNRSTVPHARRM